MTLTCLVRSGFEAMEYIPWGDNERCGHFLIYGLKWPHMSMLSYSEVTIRKYILVNDHPYEVLSAHVFQKQMRRPVNQTKLRSLITGKVIEQTFHQTEKVEEAEIGTKEVKYLYPAKGEYWFSDVKDQSNRFALSADTVGNAIKFVKTNSVTTATVFDDAVIGLKLPIKVELKVSEAAPAVKGNTAQGASKIVVLETGATVTVPLFINEGDIVRVNTETGEYTERVEKA